MKKKFVPYLGVRLETIKKWNEIVDEWHIEEQIYLIKNKGADENTAP